MSKNNNINCNCKKHLGINNYSDIINNSRIFKTAALVYRLKRNIKLKLFPPSRDEKRFNPEEDYTTLTEIDLDIEPSVAIHIHAFHTEIFHEMTFFLNNIPFDYTCFITTDTLLKKIIIEAICDHFLNSKKVNVIIVPNVGRDIAPWLIEMRNINSNFDFWCHVHTKKSSHAPMMGERWRNYLLDNLLGCENQINAIIDKFHKNEDLGLVFPPTFIEVANKKNLSWGLPLKKIEEHFNNWGIDKPKTLPNFPAGTMLWYRSKALKNLFNIRFKYNDFEENGALNGNIIHILERSLDSFSSNLNYRTEKILSPNEHNMINIKPDVIF